MTVPAQVLAAVRSIPHPRQEPDMTTVDKTGASDAEFQARIDRFGIYEPEEKVERVARALYTETHKRSWDHASASAMGQYRRLAAAGIAEMSANMAGETQQWVGGLAEDDAVREIASRYADADTAWFAINDFRDWRAAIAAMPASPAEEAVNPLDFIDPHVVKGDQFGNGWNMALRFLAQRRAAIAAPQTGEHTTDEEGR